MLSNRDNALMSQNNKCFWKVCLFILLDLESGFVWLSTMEVIILKNKQLFNEESVLETLFFFI